MTKNHQNPRQNHPLADARRPPYIASAAGATRSHAWWPLLWRPSARHGGLAPPKVVVITTGCMPPWYMTPPPSPEPGAPRTGDGSPTSFDPDAFMDAPWNEEMGVGTETTVGAAIRGGAEQHKQMREQSDRGWFTHLRKEAVFSAPRSVASFRDQVLGERTWNVDTEADDFDPFRSVTSAHGSRAGDGGGSVWGGSTARHVRRHTPSHMHDSPHREDVGGPFAQLPMSVQLTWRQVLRETSSQCVRAFCVCAGAGSSHVCVRVRVCFARVQPSVSVEAHPSEAD